MSNLEDWQKYILASFLAVVITLLIRLFGYAYTGSVALELEALHVIFDVVLTVFVLLAISIVHSNFSKKAAYGLFKLEDIVSLFISLLIAYFGIDFIISGISSAPALSFSAAMFELVSCISLFMTGYTKGKAGALIKSPALRSDSKHTYTDVYEALGVSLGLIAYAFTSLIYFYYFAIGIAFVVLMLTSYTIAKYAVLGLLDLPKDKSTLLKIVKITKTVKGVNSVKDAKVRWAGPVIFVELVVEMDPQMSIEEAHPITEAIEDKIKKSVEGVNSVTVHVEPTERNKRTVLVPVESKEYNAGIADVLGKAPYFAIVRIDKGKGSISYTYVKNDLIKKKRIGQDFRKILERNKVTDIICRDVGEGLYGVACSERIECWKSRKKSLNENIALLQAKKLKLAKMHA